MKPNNKDKSINLDDFFSTPVDQILSETKLGRPKIYSEKEAKQRIIDYKKKWYEKNKERILLKNSEKKSKNIYENISEKKS